MTEKEKEAQPKDQLRERHGQVDNGSQKVMPREGESGQYKTYRNGEHHHQRHGDQAGEKRQPYAVEHLLGKGALNELRYLGHKDKERIAQICSPENRTVTPPRAALNILLLITV